MYSINKKRFLIALLILCSVPSGGMVIFGHGLGWAIFTVLIGIPVFSPTALLISMKNIDHWRVVEPKLIETGQK